MHVINNEEELSIKDKAKSSKNTKTMAKPKNSPHHLKPSEATAISQKALFK